MSRFKTSLQLSALAVVAWTTALVALEYGSRLIMPITLWPTYVSPDGKPVKVVQNRLTLTPGLVYRQIATEFDATTTITPRGHRVPEPNGNPEIVFIGDSFTFGWGIADRDTFVYRYCTAIGKQCANLGRPNTGTGRQVDILDHFLEHEHWQPREVKLFMFVISSILMPGNDLYDNLQDAHGPPSREAPSPVSAEPQSLYERIFEWRKALLEDSNLVRVIKYVWSPWLRARLYPAVHEEELHEALEITRRHLARLDALSQGYGFAYKIYVLHPMQDLLNRTYPNTLEAIRSLAPNVTVIDTAPGLLDDPLKYYFHYDAHLNPEGTKRVAELLLAEDGRQ